MEKFHLLFGVQLTEAIAKKIHLLLYKPSPQVLPVTIIYIFPPAAPTYMFLIGILNAASLELRLAVGKSENEVGDVVLPSFFIITQST